MPFGSALSALVRFGAAAELEFGVETLSIDGGSGGPEDSPGDYAWVAAGVHLCYSVTLHGGTVFVTASLVDSIAPPQTLLRTTDDETGWRLAYSFFSSLEKYEVRSLARPITVGDPVIHDPATCWIVS